MLGHLQTLLDGIIANPEERLGAPLLTAAEVQHLMSEQQRVRPTNPCILSREELEQSLGDALSSRCTARRTPLRSKPGKRR